ncbi:hypothetical protein [Citrobacter portucalensis]|uniref:hypothetical protein n=1 Tax=Citrobacter portucalensis TaxID=1639133 RepID=UPI001F1A3076|nr:hypothetical protein [Citrobacter portucalensis]
MTDTMNLTAFIRRARECRTEQELDRLHSLMCRVVPASQRQPFIRFIEQQEVSLLQTFDTQKLYLWEREKFPRLPDK